eukprot:jgi/Ulvmu1/6290/UM281_0003.1
MPPMNGHHVVTGDRQGHLALFRPADGAMLATKRLRAEPLLALAAAAPDTLAVGAASGAAFWRIQRELPYNVVRGGHSGPVIGLYACSGGLGQVAGERDFRIFSASLDGTLRLWDPATLACLSVYRGAPSDVTCCTFFEGWNVLASGHDCGALTLWNVATGTPSVLRHHGNTVSCMDLGVIAKDLEHLVTGSYDGYIAVWDIRSGGGQHPSLLSRWLAHSPPRARPGNTRSGGTSPAPSATPPPEPPATAKLYGALQHSTQHAVSPRGNGGAGMGEVSGDGGVAGLIGPGGAGVPPAGDGGMHGTGGAQHAALAAATSTVLAGAAAGRAAALARPSAIAAEMAATAAAAYPNAPACEASAAVARSAAAVGDGDSSAGSACAAPGARDVDDHSCASGATAARDESGVAPRDGPNRGLRKCVSFADDQAAQASRRAVHGSALGDPAAGEAPGGAVPGHSAAARTDGGVGHALRTAAARRAGVVPDMALRREVRAVVFQLGGGLLCSGGADAVVKVWRPAQAELVGVGHGHHEAVTCMTHDRNLLFSGSEDTQVLAWDLCSAKRAAGAPAELHPLFALRGHSAAVTAVAMLRSAGRLASCGSDGLLLLWDYAARHVARRIQHSAPLLCLACRADREEVLVGSQDASILRFALRDPLQEPVQGPITMTEAMSQAERCDSGAGSAGDSPRFGLVPATSPKAGELRRGARQRLQGDSSGDEEEARLLADEKAAACQLEPLPICVMESSFDSRAL